MLTGGNGGNGETKGIFTLLSLFAPVEIQISSHLLAPGKIRRLTPSVTFIS
jgi:hypothetical protein